MTTAKSVQAEIDAINEKRDRAIQELANRVRRDVVVPFCRERRLRFVAGNGTWFFARGSGPSTVRASDHDNDWFHLRIPIAAAREIVDVLSVWPDTAGPLGSYMSDVEMPTTAAKRNPTKRVRR